MHHYTDAGITIDEYKLEGVGKHRRRLGPAISLSAGQHIKDRSEYPSSYPSVDH